MRIISDALKNKINSQNQTLFDKSDPKMRVSIARAKNTVVDSTYWTVETIREISGLGDISVAPRRFKPTGRPNRIYEIHVINGIVKTSIREYPDKLKAGFIDQFSLGSGSSVGVAFNGHWQRYRNLYRLITDEKPYISWAASDGKLWVQKWDDVSSKLQLSSGVSKVRMIRAWKNTVINYLDQGLIVAYIKTDGKVYYRNFAIQEDYSEVWEYEKELAEFTGTAVNLNLFITNDYRMGFIIEDSLGQIHWLVTPRNWGGMASPAENINTGITDLMFKVTPIKYYDTFDNERIDTSIEIERFYLCPADVIPLITGAERLKFADKKTVAIAFNYDLECELANLKNTMTIRNTAGTYFTIDNITQSGKILTISTVEEMPFSQNVIVEYNSPQSYHLAFRISSTCLYDYSSPISFLIEGIPPIGYESENITVGIADLSFVATEIDYIRSYETESIDTSISDISVVVTKVGENPL